MNITIISGNLVREPELLETKNGTAYCNFSLAVNGDTYNTEGEKTVYFYNCIAWREKAELIAKYCQKGSRIALRGEMQSNSYKDKEGQTKTLWNFVVNYIEFLGTKKSDIEESGQSNKRRERQMTAIDDTMPF